MPSAAELNPAGLPVLPDSVARKLDKGQSVAVEEVREAAIDQLRAGRTHPVHAEDLKPITRAEAAARRTQTGSTLPSMPATRRVIPAPFQRPRIDASRHGKQWVRVRADQVRPGDIVPGAGRVAMVETKIRYVPRSTLVGGFALAPETAQAMGVPAAADPPVAVGENVVLTGGAGLVLELDVAEVVQAFRRPDGV